MRSDTCDVQLDQFSRLSNESLQQIVVCSGRSGFALSMCSKVSRITFDTVYPAAMGRLTKLTRAGEPWQYLNGFQYKNALGFASAPACLMFEPGHRQILICLNFNSTFHYASAKTHGILHGSEKKFVKQIVQEICLSKFLEQWVGLLKLGAITSKEQWIRSLIFLDNLSINTGHTRR